jgi:ribonuclease HI
LTGIYTGPLNGGVAVVLIYTDGGCDPNPGKGAWAAILIKPDGSIQKISGCDPQTTNNRMEMTAVLMALRKLPIIHDQVIVRSDSELLVKTLKGQYRRKANLDLWQEVHHEVKRFPAISFEWVRGHAGDRYNEMADRLVQQARNSAPDRPSNKPPPATFKQHLGPKIPPPQNDAERDRLLDEYIQLKFRYREMSRAGARGNYLVKRDYQRLEAVLIPLIPPVQHYRQYVLVRGFNDYGQHIQVFTETSFQKHQEAARESERLKSIRREK